MFVIAQESPFNPPLYDNNAALRFLATALTTDRESAIIRLENSMFRGSC
jgi:hypothetical protein